MKANKKEPEELYKVTFYVKIDDIPFRKGMTYHAQPLVDSLNSIGVKNLKIQTVTLEKPDKVFLQERIHDNNGYGNYNLKSFSTPKPNKMIFKENKK